MVLCETHEMKEKKKNEVSALSFTPGDTHTVPTAAKPNTTGLNCWDYLILFILFTMKHLLTQASDGPNCLLEEGLG